ncbi:MAG: lamin tail domain-containing protein, partial [Bacteroidota bacterium]
MKLPLLLAGLLIIGHCRAQQQVITHWNFNSVPPDNSTSSGSMQPSTGNGVLFSCGTVQFDFASGSGSGDSGSDNTALSLSKFPAQSQGDLSAGVGFGTDLTGFRKISVRADLRLTGTASANYSLQYSLDSGASWISAVPFTSTVAAGNWHKDQLFDLSQIQQLDQCPKARFRFVSTFESGTGKYRPVQSTSTYSSSGTLRVDRLTILGESSIPVIDITPPAVMSILPLDSRRIDIVFNEPLDRKSIHDSCFSGIPGVFNALPASTDSGIYTVSLNFPNGYPQGKYHQLTIRYIADTSGNPMNAGTFPVFHNASRPNVLVSEIMYNNPGTDDYEYLELFNAGADTAFIEAFRMSGVEHRFGGFDLPPGKALLLAKNGPLCTARYGRMFYTWDSGSLSNSGEAIVLYNGGGEMIDSVYYRTTAAWPKMANGNGAALELKTPTGDHTDPKNWRDSF